MSPTTNSRTAIVVEAARLRIRIIRAISIVLLIVTTRVDSDAAREWNRCITTHGVFAIVPQVKALLWALESELRTALVDAVALLHHRSPMREFEAAMMCGIIPLSSWRVGRFASCMQPWSAFARKFA